jgi:poly-gamma-glutamate capsule biosynthesis protein CapA/YwtB (metallophosphatase superfamily)
MLAMTETTTLFLCGDVMLGRGIDQVLPHPGEAGLHEQYVRSAEDYVAFAEQRNGAIPRPVNFSYVWGDVLAELGRANPQARIINLETSVTTNREYAPKGINYKMNPANIGCLTAAGVDCCVLANNHVLDFGRSGLLETLETLQKASIRSAGAGHSVAEAQAATVIPTPSGSRVVVFAFGCTSSGIPPDWAADGDKPGVNLLRDLSDRTVSVIAQQVKAVRPSTDLVVASIHWGGNWGYPISRDEMHFAHALIDVAGFDVVHGHSSHHPKAIEVYRGKPILYGCGDFINDYEGIGGYEAFRTELVLMYLPRFDHAGGLIDLRLVPFRISQFRLQRASRDEAMWLSRTLDRESAKFGTRVSINVDNSLTARAQ